MITTNNKQTEVGNTAKVSPNHMYVTEPGLFGQIKWALLRALLSTVGRTSKGILIGYTFGFDSGTMLDYVYANEANGSLGVGKLIDRLYLDAIGWRAIRARRTLLKRMLRAEVERNRVAGKPTRLLDVAAGPGRYLQELLQECNSEQGDLHILCRDLAMDGILRGAKQAEVAGLQTIHYEQGDAFNPAPTDVQLGGAPNVIVVSGLYELILEDETIQQSLVRLYQMLAPGGALYFTTQTHHPQLAFIANVLPNRNGSLWVMKCRAAAQLEAWVYNAGFSQVQSQAEEVGLFTVTMARKATG
jgi:SAM-dependent methyltransferase